MELEQKFIALDKSQAIIEFYPDGSIVTANHNFLGAMGYDLAEVQGRHHSMFVDTVVRNSVEYKQFWEDLRAGKFQAAQYKRFGKGGKEVWIEATYNPILDKEGKVYKIVKFATDITEFKLRNSEFEGKLSALNKSQAIIEFTLDGIILAANENFLDTMGYSLSEIKGGHHSMFVDPEYRNSQEYKMFWEGLRTGKFQAAQYKRFGKGGKEVWIEASYNPIFDMNGKPFKVVKFATNITNTVEKIISIKQDMNAIEEAVLVLKQQTTLAAGGSNETSTNVQTVAAGAEELDASVVEIARSMSRSTDAASDAYGRIIQTGEETKKLLHAAQEMNGIVTLIQKIAEQVNLLSLNATIEAARAGEAGKGFAVVASEVKGLATQVAEATHKIGSEINNIQDVVSNVAGSLQDITQSIDNARNYVTGATTAIEEQSNVTRDMSSSMQNAAEAVNDISHNLTNILATLSGVSDSVAKTRIASEAII
ncbi:MAG TPA: chemotaxis protein [Rhodospirillaceae bacterium]|nr:chemotaxis protein [Rhodospirillaceae bacterium]